MKVKTIVAMNFWKKEEDIDNKEREFLKVGTTIEVSEEVYESRLKNYVDVVEEKPKKLTKAQAIAIAKENGIEFDSNIKVDDLIALIKENAEEVKETETEIKENAEEVKE